ncbi:hypothetical protein HID58_095474 [Brassica napus]|uniref:FKB95-like N-terminal Kelch domain-containing protein n=1 Tax=Brassica napus TaxID=3708 RepID=A0ABQ7X5W2_BRANA|nr:hypothetical protein HID58_095474 [Brassica napus]
MALLARLYSRPKRSTKSKVEQPPPQKKEEMNTITVSTRASLCSRPIRSTKLEQPPQKKKKEYRSLSLVSKTFRSLISSPELYTVRSQIGNTEPCLCIRQELPTHDRWYILDQTLVTTTNSNGLIKDEFNLLPITFSTTLAVGFEIYQIGGDQLPSSTVRVLDFRTRTWRDAPDMGVARKCPESALIDSKIYVVGGGTEESEVFDLKSQTWNPLPSLSDDGDYPEVQLRRGELFATTSKHKNHILSSFPWLGICGNMSAKNRRIWCAVIKFEKRFFGLKFEVWGKVVRSNALLTVPKSFKLLSCVTL